MGDNTSWDALNRLLAAETDPGKNSDLRAVASGLNQGSIYEAKYEELVRKVRQAVNLLGRE